MSVQYHLYAGIKSNGDSECIAIDPDELGENYGALVVPKDFFKPGTTDVKKVGEIQITGDTYLLDSSFSVVI